MKTNLMWRTERDASKYIFEDFKLNSHQIFKLVRGPHLLRHHLSFQKRVPEIIFLGDLCMKQLKLM